MIAGIDPGLSGGIAILDQQGHILLVEDLPTLLIAHGKTKKPELDLAGLRGLLLAHPLEHVAIEQVAAMPKQGVTGMFRFGFTAGAIGGLVAGLQLPHTLVLPRTWQRACQCQAGPEASRQRALQLFPTVSNRLARKRDAGRAAAILIAFAYMKSSLSQANT
jgi:crossover junction endodeoxyribonuclease RuvC